MMLRTISIQRSFDSLRNYTTIGSVENPQNRENAYADATPPYDNMYYRVFVAFAGGSYVFSKAARPGKSQVVLSDLVPIEKLAFQHLPIPVSGPGIHVYKGNENDVLLHLPEAGTKKYSLRIFDESNNQLFYLTKLHNTDLTIEKGNFKHAGWFWFELYEKGKLIEKNRIYISRDDKTEPASDR